MAPLLVLALLLSACRPDTSSQQGHEAGDPGTADTTRFTLADFQGLRFIEGTWRGSAPGATPFFETYRVLDDSTIRMHTWTDSTRTVAGEETEYRLRDGAILAGKDGRLLRRDHAGYAFAAPTYAWTFRPASADRWTAQVGPSTTYVMERVPDK